MIRENILASDVTYEGIGVDFAELRQMGSGREVRWAVGSGLVVQRPCGTNWPSFVQLLCCRGAGGSRSAAASA